MKRTYQWQGKGTCVYDYETSFIEDFSGCGERSHLLSWSRVWEELDTVALDHADRFDVEYPDHDPPMYEQSYQERMGMEYPPLYRIKVTVEVEPLSVEETQKLWEARQVRKKRK